VQEEMHVFAVAS